MYERYFGEKPSDYGNHNFARWSESSRYLGKRFHELLSEERFEEEKFAGSTSLRRPATASAPAITLSDSASKPRVVGWINLVSTPNPSPEFIQRVVKSLSESWGIPSANNAGTEWVWQQRGFAATLAHWPTSAQGAFLSLVVKEK